MKLIHYSAQPLAEPCSTAQPGRPNSKPVGLWVSVQGEDDWKSWCEGEGFGLERLRHSAVISLAEDAKILRLTNSIEIDMLDERFGVALYQSIRYVDWKAVAACYQGIIIAPYVWARRLDGRASGWYYGWDCASGCIWDSPAIAKVERLVSADAV